MDRVRILAVGCLLLTVRLPAQARREPLPLDVAVSAVSHNGRSSFNRSPDGEWMAHTWGRPEQLGRDGPYYSKSGVPFAEGGSRMQAGLTNTKTGQVVLLGGTKGSSWAPVFSPDGQRVAFYADDDGEAGVWIWERATGKATRFPGVIARPFFGFEFIRWSADGRRLLTKILPEGLTIAQANDLTPEREGGRKFPASGPDGPTVLVFSNAARRATDTAQAAAPRAQSTAFADRSIGDVAVLDLTSRRATRLSRRGHPLWFTFSPDQKFIAFTDLAGFIPNSQQPAFTLSVHDVSTGETRVVARELPLSYGIELSWSPDSRRIAFVRTGSMSKGEFSVITVADGQVRTYTGNGAPSFDQGDGEHPPLWDATGNALYAIGTDGKLWRVDVSSGAAAAVADVAGRNIRAVVSKEGRLLWTTNSGKEAWFVTRERTGDLAGVHAVDLTTMRTRPLFEARQSLSGIFNVDGNDATGEISFVARDQQHLADVWAANTSTGARRQVSHLNARMEGYELGTARVISYRGLEGQPLRAALLLPPGYQEGQKLPTLVWVYGGSMGSQYVNTFGLWGDLATFNMHILATRGYAVLFPDTPLGPGTPMKDLLNTVMPAVNAAIEQGYSDPDRLAVSGQSYGSYSSLALIAQTRRFKAAIITAAVLHPDLFAAYLEMSPDGTASSIGYYEQGQGNMRGDIWKERERYFENSPLFLFDQIETPLLIGQGEKDGRLIASDAMFVALRRLGKDVEYRIYANEEHVITGRANVIDFWQRRLAFLEQHLGRGRVDE